MADFRREYGLSWRQVEGLPVHEFVVLLFGLSKESRLVAEASSSATVQVMQEQPKTVEAFAAHLSRHPGAVVEVVKRVK